MQGMPSARWLNVIKPYAFFLGHFYLWLLPPSECLTVVFSPNSSYVPGGSSLFSFFRAELQSWLMFVQKYVIADFLLINRSRVQAASIPCYYHLCASRLVQGVLSHSRRQITLSLLSSTVLKVSCYCSNN